MTNKFGGKYIFVIVILVLIGLIWWRGSDDKAITSADIGKLGLGEVATYKAEEDGFTFAYPDKLKVTETPIKNENDEQIGKTILVESTDSGPTAQAGKGFEITVLPFDEDIVLTKERILQDLPQFKIEKEKSVKVGGDISALAFESQDEGIGETYEIWFVHKGYIYEARTYRSFGETMEKILGTWEFQ